METSRRNFLAAAAATVGTVATTPLALAADKFGRDRDWTGDTTVTYPEPAWEVRDKRFAGVQGNATLQRIWHGMGNDRALWCEGPVWMGDWGSLVWSDIPNHRTLRWIEDDGHVSVFQTDSGYSNGHTRDNQGRLIAMEHDTRRVRRREYDGTWTVLADNFEGKKLNAPNDAAVHSDGSIWFTDPGYGILGPYEGHKAEFELPTRVYRIDPSGKTTVAVEGPTSNAAMSSTPEPPTARSIRPTSSCSTSPTMPCAAARSSPTSSRGSPTVSAVTPTAMCGAVGAGVGSTPTACVFTRPAAICSRSCIRRKLSRTSASAAPSATGCS